MDLATELTRLEGSKRDFLADTRDMSMAVTVGKGVGLMVDTEEFGLTPHAHRQIAQRINIPQGYYDRMLTSAPDLLSVNVNRWFSQTPERRMVRTLEGSARAFLSDRYLRLDNFDVAQMVLQAVQDKAVTDLHFVSSEVTDSRLYMKFVTPQVQREVKKGDIIQAGLVVSNSEIGLGALKVEPLLYRLVCLNGAIMGAALRKYHVGKKNDAEGELERILSDETRAADDAALRLRLRDVMRSALDMDAFSANVDLMAAAQGDAIEGDPVRAVEVLANKFTLNQGEQSGVLRSLIEGADLSRFGLLNAVTAYSQKVQDYDRATELEQIGGQIITINANDWREIKEAA